MLRITDCPVTVTGVSSSSRVQRGIPTSTEHSRIETDLKVETWHTHRITVILDEAAAKFGFCLSVQILAIGVISGMVLPPAQDFLLHEVRHQFARRIIHLHVKRLDLAGEVVEHHHRRNRNK
jgi:hypothetical protein